MNEPSEVGANMHVPAVSGLSGFNRHSDSELVNNTIGTRARLAPNASSETTDRLASSGAEKSSSTKSKSQSWNPSFSSNSKPWMIPRPPQPRPAHSRGS